MRRAIAVFLLFCNYCAYAQQEGFAPGNGVRTYYRSFGSGDPVLIINGGPGISSEGFAGIAAILAKSNRIILYDQRGTGRSQLPRKDVTTITMALMADDIERLREQLGYEHWIVMGHSFGGMLASYYTARYPARVRALVLSSSGGIDLALYSSFRNSLYEHLTPTEADSLRYWDGRMQQGDSSPRVRTERARWMAFAYVFRKENAPLVAARLLETDQEVNRLVWQDLRRIRFDCAPALAGFEKPVLILQGRNDNVDSSAALKANRVLRHSRLLLLDRCRHYGWLDRPDLFVPKILAFLKEVPRD